MDNDIPEINELIKQFSKLPGLGPKSAKRIILKLINNKDNMVKPLAKSLAQVYKKVVRCVDCGNLKIIDKAVFIEHIKGYVGLGETSIIIAVACKHRDETYVLSRYIIEEIKKRSPIWKKEHYKNEQSEWLKGNPIKNEKI